MSTSLPLEVILDHYGISYRSSSGEQTILCPVHDDKVASCSLNIGKGLWHCHACGKSGDAVKMVMEKEGMDFASATAFVQGIAGASGISLRDKPLPRKRVPPGSGYSPGYRKGIQDGRRRRPGYGS